MLKKEKNNKNMYKTAALTFTTMLLLTTVITTIVSSGDSDIPEIEIKKTGPVFAYLGDEITYFYNISNIGNVPISNICVLDDKCGPINYVSGDNNENEKLDVFESWILSCTYTPEFTFPNPLVNTATVTGKYKNETVEEDVELYIYPFVLSKDVLVNCTGELVDYDDPETLFTVNMSRNGEFLDTFTISESKSISLWLSKGTYQFCEVDLPEGFESVNDCIVHITGESDPEFTFENIKIIEEQQEPPEPRKPKPTTKSPSKSIPGNSGPVADAGGPYYGILDEEIEFDGSGSYDKDGTITYYGWSLGDGETEFEDIVTHSYSSGGSFVVSLTVIDDKGASDTDTTTAFITVPNRPPSIPIISGPSKVIKEILYSYAFGSTDLDREDIDYLIEWGDGYTFKTENFQSGDLFSMIHSWAEPGEYTIKVTASDDQTSSSSEITVIVEENIVADNIILIILGIIVILSLIAVLIYSKKGKK